ncbi:fumarylacetoacetate hydrolase family protein [Burkholderia sp. IMCC1007]|uniref:fumarylacetoacetate hydrolase family protein n=1 Tax=Burkholderia sp. IMCC1007 TaxID=3004104 RepID=UPI0022B46AE5|nr:fumarylacetoacetate hydrolase family protein [Burkholderia sp. IMCC1007]
MRFTSFVRDGTPGLAIRAADGRYLGLTRADPDYPGDLDTVVSGGPAALADANQRLQLTGRPLDLAACTLLPPVTRAAKIICVGLNYAEHSQEAGYEVPSYPTLFARFHSSLTAHGAAIRMPAESAQLDYEGELAVIIGRRGRRIGRSDALNHVAGYTIFNDATLRDFQFKTPQWTVGKNFDETGALGPELVTADELPAGAAGLALQTRLNGVVVQEANTNDMIFDIATLIATISEVMTLEPGDVIATGTPSGIGMARNPPLWMRAGDVCEVEIEGLGVLGNTVVQS